MQLGFVSAILPEYSLNEVLQTGQRIGYDCVEVMCWPKGKAERRYAGVTHIDVDDYNPKAIKDITDQFGVSISGLGYYPNPLDPDEEKSSFYLDHIVKVIDAAAILQIGVVNTFVGRDPKLTIDENWGRFLSKWEPVIRYAEKQNIKIGIENCPMRFTADEWPGGKNLAVNPAIWDRMFADINSDYFGLNYDPSHLILQHMDPILPIQEYAGKFFHVHAKDARIDRKEVNRFGVFAHPNLWHTPKLPGMGDVDWGKFFSELTSSGYTGAVCVEVEDRAYEGGLDLRIASLVQSHDYLRQFIPRKLE